MLNSSVAFVVSDVRPLSAVEGGGLIQFANAIIKVGATHGVKLTLTLSNLILIEQESRLLI